MRLRKLTLRNFMPYRSEQTVTFPAGSRNVVVIYGDNMRGKTSFLNALRFVFFGNATARHLRRIDLINLVNSQAKADGDWTLAVTVELESDHSVYELRRELRPAQHIIHPTSDADLRQTFTLRKNGIPITGGEQTFEMNQIMPEGISRFFLFDGELLQEYEILVRDADAAARIKLAIEHVLGMPALTKGGEEIRTLLNQAQERQADDLKQNQTLTAQAEQQRALQKRIGDLRSAYSTQLSNLDKLESEALSLQDRLEAKSEAVELSRKLAEWQGDLKVSTAALENLRSRRADLLQEAWRDLLEPQIQIVRRGLEAERDEELSAVKSGAVILAKIVGIRQSISDAHCVTCEQPVAGPEVTNLVNRLKQLENDLKQAKTGVNKVSELSNRIEQLARIRGLGFADRVMVVEQDIRKVLLGRTTLTRAITEARAHLLEFEPAEVERLRSEREQVLSVAASVEREATATRKEIEGATRKLDQISRMLSRNPEVRTQRSSRLVAAYGALDRIFTAGVDILRNRQRKRVEDYATAAFAQLTSEQDFRTLSINENYGLTIMDEKGRAVPERSAGAEQIVALSLIDGLNKAGRRGGPIVMDTPFGRLDWTHRRNVLSFLPEMAEQVVLLVHEGEMDRERDLPPLRHRVSKIYRIDRISSRESAIVLESEEAIE